MKQDNDLDIEAVELLVMGPKASKDGELGGVVVSFELFLTELRKRGIRHYVIDLNTRNYSNYAVAAVSILCELIRHIKDAKHISLHGQTNDYVYIAPVVVSLASVFSKSVSLRKFAGDFDELFDRMNVVKRCLVTHALKRSSFCFFETRYLVEKFRNFNKSTFWFPNARPVGTVTRQTQHPYSRRFVFMGHVREEKGINEILEAAKRLGNDYSFALYGRVASTTYNSFDWTARSNVSYEGQVAPSKIPEILSEQDVLVLPSYREGYPGVVVEALHAGLPIVATRLRGICEMITDGKEGFLIEPRDVSSLVDAIESFDAECFERMSDSARARATDFDSAAVTDKFLRTIGVEW